MYMAPVVTLAGTRSIIPNGDNGVFSTIRNMRKIVNEYKTDMTVRACALSILYLVPQKFDIAECEAIFDFVRDQIRYTKDVNGVETLSTPAITLATRQGDCDDKSTLLCALFEAVGYPTRFVIASYVTGQFEHVYVQVAVDGDWINADATENYPFGWCPPDAIRIDFERT